MSPTHDSEDSEVEKRASPSARDKEPSSATSTKPAAKRRTKTGCLTCRKRRIKCGEEKPFCKNCIKSKRDCAGYVQPLVYKQHNQGLHSAGRDALERGSFSEQDQFQFNALDVHTSQAELFNPFVYAGYNDAHVRHGSLPSSQRHQYPPPETSSSYILQSPVPLAESYRRHSMQHHHTQHPYALSDLHGPTQSGDQPWSLRSQQSSISETATHPYVEPASNLTSPYDIYPQYHGGTPGYFPYGANPLHETLSRRYSVHGFVQASPFEAPVPTLANPPVSLVPKEEENDDSDDYGDVEMEDSRDLAELGHGREQRFAELLASSQKHAAPGAEPRVRVPSSRALQAAQKPMLLSPLQDERNERLFCHFVEVTSRCMSTFERPPTDTWSLPRRTLWSYTLPSAAMSHPALAHAMLALSGLHVAKLQQSSEDPSLKHFTYALRRVGNLLGLPKRRHEITTLATVLLLGFYEVLAADHSRWNLHLTGATRLVLEHDYAAMIRTARRMRNHAKENILQFSGRSALTEENYLSVAGIPESLLDDEEWEVDQSLISSLTGQEVDYDHQIQPNFAGSKILDDFSDQDVAEVKIKMDLRWWYCKQDVFQSMISGDPLLMDYEQWKYCPPRGRIGNANMPYGTFDHLLLILGRLSNFGGKDRSRKQRVIASQGGHWMPPAGLFPPGPPPTAPPAWKANAPGHPPSASIASVPAPAEITVKAEDGSKPSPAPSANEGRVRQSKHGPAGPQLPSSGPSFHGMMPPPPGAPKMHSSFYAMHEKLQGKWTPTVKSELDEESSTRPDLKHETDQAVAEHAAIAKAFDLFAQSLGPDFEPLANDGSFMPTSPFGPPLRYQSPSIAAIWLHYYVGKILLHRLHPHMPPAAMVAAGVTAHLTREHAQNVGKAAAGLYAMNVGGPGVPLDPTYAGALIESTFPLLFAAVQFQDAAQRGWTISKLHDIARMTGWQTSGAVAGACEIAWERLGQAGKGPPYTRSLDRDNKDARVNGDSRRLDPRSTAGYAGQADTGDEAESQFVSHDRALIGEHGPTRVHWALGLLSVEEDIKKLDIGK